MGCDLYRFVEPLLLDSLIHEVDDWEFTQFEATNRKRKIVIWIANRRWALRVYVDGRKVSRGDVVLFSIAPWRYRLWRRICAIKNYREIALLDRWMDEQERAS